MLSAELVFKLSVPPWSNFFRATLHSALPVHIFHD
jgi:hypothetical protein